MERPKLKLVLLPGGKAKGDADEQRSRAELQLLPRDAGDDVRKTIEHAVEAARRVRLEIEQRIAQALDDPPPP
jgi:hypothetical protein